MFTYTDIAAVVVQCVNNEIMHQSVNCNFIYFHRLKKLLYLLTRISLLIKH